MKRRFFFAALSFIFCTILTLEGAANLDLILTHAQGQCTINPAYLFLHALSSRRCLFLWAALDGLGLVGIYWALFGLSHINYRSDMYEVVPGFEEPMPEGQGQHGTAWWLPAKDYGKAFSVTESIGNNLPKELEEHYKRERRDVDAVILASETE